MSSLRITTIGVYGFNKSTFFEALREAKVAVFCDIRSRRGVRGTEFAFANSKRLQNKLHSLGIKYIYVKELAPSDSTRNLQRQANKASHATRLHMSRLCDAFIVAYETETLSSFKIDEFIQRFGLYNETITFFCVEGQPESCHRSLVAERFSRELGVSLVHLKPDVSGGG
jgi:uncharacterized protein (DUF488 family)